MGACGGCSGDVGHIVDEEQIAAGAVVPDGEACGARWDLNLVLHPFGGYGSHGCGRNLHKVFRSEIVGILGGVPYLDAVGIVGGIAAGVEAYGLRFAVDLGRNCPVVDLAVVRGIYGEEHLVAAVRGHSCGLHNRKIPHPERPFCNAGCDAGPCYAAHAADRLKVGVDEDPVAESL